MCVFVRVCMWVSECLINKALGWPWYPAARLAVIETDFIMNFKHRSNLLHQITERNPPFPFLFLHRWSASSNPPVVIRQAGEEGEKMERNVGEKKKSREEEKEWRKERCGNITCKVRLWWARQEECAWCKPVFHPGLVKDESEHSRVY